MPRINLLPWRDTERKRKRQEFYLSLGAALVSRPHCWYWWGAGR